MRSQTKVRAFWSKFGPSKGARSVPTSEQNRTLQGIRRGLTLVSFSNRENATNTLICPRALCCDLCDDFDCGCESGRSRERNFLACRFWGIHIA